MNDDILTKFMLGETSSEEEVAVNQWIKENRNNEKYFKDFQLIWETSRRFTMVSTVNEDEAWNNFKLKRKESESSEPEAEVIPIHRGYSWMKIAATLLLLVVAGAYFYTTFNKKTDIAVAMIKVHSTQEVITKTLADGSVVTLNKNSTLSYPEKFAGNTREIILEDGEAFFNVTPDKSKPFIVKTNEVEVNVVGTSFNVKAGKEETEVIVETGIVKVSKKDAEVKLVADEMVSINKVSNSLTKKKSKDRLHNYYRTNKFIADNTPLWRIVEILNEAYGAHIVLGRDNLRDLPLNAVLIFKDESLENNLVVICETFKLEMTKTNDKIIIK